MGREYLVAAKRVGERGLLRSQRNKTVVENIRGDQ